MTQMAKLLKTMLAVIVVVAMTMISAGCEEKGSLSNKDHPSASEQSAEKESESDSEHPAKKESKSDSEHPKSE